MKLFRYIVAAALMITAVWLAAFASSQTPDLFSMFLLMFSFALAIMSVAVAAGK